MLLLPPSAGSLVRLGLAIYQSTRRKGIEVADTLGLLNPSNFDNGRGRTHGLPHLKNMSFKTFPEVKISGARKKGICPERENRLETRSWGN